jgi:hypothetical protein
LNHGSKTSRDREETQGCLQKAAAALIDVAKTATKFVVNA